MKSMTGFGRATLERNNRNYEITIKSVNSKYADVNIKLPYSLNYLEADIKKTIVSRVSRGKIDVYIGFDNYSEDGKDIVINEALANKYIESLRKVADEHELNGDVKALDILRFPNVVEVKTSDEDNDEISKEVMECLNNAIDEFIKMREVEGEKIKEDLKKRIDDVEINVEKLPSLSEGLIANYSEKLEKRISEILKNDVIDQNLLAQEVVIYADKTSIEEELTRLRSHVIQFNNLLEEDGPVGKKFDFLLQEMNRETNTTGSKAGSIDITNIVVDLKTQIEDIREQVQNIE